MEGIEGFYKELLDSLYEGVYFVDIDRKITYWNRGAERITGYSASQVLGCLCSDNLLIHVDDEGTPLCGLRCPLVGTTADGNPREAEVFLRHREGHRVPVRVRASPFRDARGAIVGSVEVFTQNLSPTGILDRMEDLRRMALLDHLTEVANRRYLEMLLRSKLDELDRYGWPLGLLFVDVDHFKQINDSHGHAVGDRTLGMIARTLSAGARSFDLVGRWGGEEFLVLLVNVTEPGLAAIAERLRMLVETSGLTVDTHPLRVTISVGATLATREDTVESLVARADRLMYRSKTAGRNRVTTDLPPVSSDTPTGASGKRTLETL